MRQSKNTADKPETQWTGQLIELACKLKARDLVRLGEGGEWTEDEFNRICQDRRMRADDGGKTPGDIAVYIGWMRDPITTQELERAHYLGSRAFFFVEPSGITSLDGWRDALLERFELVEIEDNGHHIIGVARPLALVGEIKVKSALSQEDRRDNMRLNCLFYRKRIAPYNFAGNTKNPHGRKAILACAGPSLRSTWPQVKMSQAQGDLVASCSMSYRFLMDRKVKPDVHIEADPRPHKVEQILPIDPTHTAFWLASCAAPEWQDHVPDAYLWHSHNGPETVQTVDELDPGQGVIYGGGSVGLRAISLLYFEGFRHIVVHGMDCSFDDAGEQHAGRHFGKVMPEIDITVGKRKFRTSPIMVAYARYFDKLTELLPDCVMELAGDGLLQAMHGKR